MREIDVDAALLGWPGELEPHGAGAVMRRTTLVAGLGVAIAVGGGAWFALAQRGTTREVRLGGVPLALGVIAFGVVVALGALIVALRRRRAAATLDELDELATLSRPRIVVRDHSHERRPAAGMYAIGAVLRGDEPASLLLSDRDTANLLRSLGKFGKEAIELLADQGMTIEDAMTAVLDRADLNANEADDLTMLVWPDAPSDGPSTVVNSQ